MKHNQYRLRTRAIATVAAIGLTGLAGCTTSPDVSAKASRSTEATTSAPSTPTRTTTPETTPPRTVSAEVLNAQARFEGASRQTVLDIFKAMADPRSHSAGYELFSYGNKAGLQQAGEDRSMKPEMFVHYFDGHTANQPRGMFVNAVRVENPQAADKDLIFDQESISLDVGTTPNELDAKLHGGRQLTIQDMIDFVSNYPTTVVTATTQHGNALATTSVAHNNDGTYSYSAMDGQRHGTGPFVIDTPNVDKLDAFSQDLQATADGMLKNL